MTPDQRGHAIRGTQSERALRAALLKLGRTVLVPYGGTCSYDLAMEEAG